MFAMVFPSPMLPQAPVVVLLCGLTRHLCRGHRMASRRTTRSNATDFYAAAGATHAVLSFGVSTRLRKGRRSLMTEAGHFVLDWEFGPINALVFEWPPPPTITLR